MLHPNIALTYTHECQNHLYCRQTFFKYQRPYFVVEFDDYHFLRAMEKGKQSVSHSPSTLPLTTSCASNIPKQSGSIFSYCLFL